MLKKSQQEIEMSNKILCFSAASCGLVLFALCALPSHAQTAAAKEKPPMYTYVATWQIPRAHWSEVGKSNEADKPILDKALADGTIVGYGADSSVVHQADAPTHDNWWASMSMAGLMKILEQFMSGGSNTPDATATATKHEDEIFVSRYYNWKSGAYKNGYTEIAMYKLKPGTSDDALDMLSKNLIAPLLEKLLADGTLIEYEVDQLAVHTDSPGYFWIGYTAAKPEGLDKVNAAIADVLKASPLSGPAFDSMIEESSHRDLLIRGDGVYK
jgi:hypothetical protein